MTSEAFVRMRRNDPKLAANNVKKEILSELNRLKEKPTEQLLKERLEKYRNMGVYTQL